MHGRSSSWWSIDSLGWKRMNAGRALGHLVREAISNAFDIPQASHCWVVVDQGYVKVQDDGPGIKDPELITTIFKTDKDEAPIMRGRKGRGLKELLSAAHRSRVVTAGLTVTFNEDGTRDTEPNAVVAGTTVEAWNPTWTGEQVQECIYYLERFMAPESIAFILNGRRRQGTKINDRIPVTLLTQVVVDGKQVDTPRATEVFTRNQREDDKSGMLYEMGIPVCPLTTPFHVDVQQRIPLNDNRDVVDDRYKRKLYAALLNHLVTTMTKHTLTDPWVLEGIGLASDETQQEYTNRLVGPKRQMVLKSDSKNANDRAKQEGLEVVDVSHMPWPARNVIERYLSDARRVIEEIERLTKPKHMDALRTQYPTMVALYEWAAQEMTGEVHTITFMEREKSYTGRYKMATYSAKDRTIRFNALYNDFNFDKPLQPKLVGAFLHEISHFKTDEHDEDFRNALEGFAGQFAMLMWHQREAAEKLLGGGALAAAAASPGKMIPITCQWGPADNKCGKVRMVKPQDVFQVRFCKEHQRENQRQRARRARLMSKLTDGASK